MTRILSALVALTLALAPAAALAVEEPTPVPVPAGIACPMPAPDATPLAPDTTTECVMEYAVSGTEMTDPCAPDEMGLVPEMCTIRPVECVLPADGVYDCPVIDDVTVAPAGGTLYGIVAMTLPDGTRISIDGGTLLVGESTISGTVGCNEIGGDTTVEDDTIIVGITWSTKMACPELATADAALAAILTGRLSLVDDGMTATLTGDAGQLELYVLETMLPLGPLDHNMDHGMHRDGSLAWLLLAFPLVSAAGALFVGLTARRD
jgi:hypothetical protein